MIRPQLCLALVAALSLGGCANLSPDGGMGAVQGATKLDLGADAIKITDETSAASAETRYRALLRQGLTADRAVQVALLANKGLQASYNELGISEAKFVEATLPPAPSLSILSVRGSGQLDIESRIVANLLSLLTLPARRELAAAQLEGAQLKAILATLKLAADTRRQFWRAVAAREQEGYLLQARASAQTASELAKRLGETGAINKLDQGREHAFYAELAAQTTKLRVQQALERERLTRQMGLWGRDIGYVLPTRLPSLPGRLQGAGRIEAQAIARRADLKLARGEVDLVARQFGLTQATRFINAFQLAGATKSSRKTIVDAATGAVSVERSKQNGAELTLEIPLFDFGAVRQREAEETYMRAANLLADKAVNVRSEAREAYIAYKGAWDVARVYQTQVLPLRKQIQNEQLLQYNGMLSDLFTLIQDARARTTSNLAAIDARRDFWLADADLKAAIIGGGSSGGAGPNVAMAGGG